jgi:ATPase subunit of ABC transporter with duplicated ATPase domains
MRLRLARALSASPDFLILDEPTNDLDRGGRGVVLQLLRRFGGGILVITHDRELLAQVDEVLDLTPKGLRRYSGSFDLYWQERMARRSRRQDELERARRERRAAEREREAKLQRQDRRTRAAALKAKEGGVPRVLAGAQKRRAQVTRGKIKLQADAAIDDAKEELDSALDALETDPFMRLDFESEAPPASRPFFEANDLNLRFDATTNDLWPAPLNVLMTGRQRWHIQGGNGAGKSTLLRLFLGETPGKVSGTLWRAERPLVYLDQCLTLLQDHLSVLDNLAGNSRFQPTELRNELAFYGFKADSVHQLAGSLSGGERMRAALARCFLGSAIPQAIVLDEPTSNLDFQSMELLEAALSRFQGLLLVVSHDSVFTDRLGITDELTLPAQEP